MSNTFSTLMSRIRRASRQVIRNAGIDPAEEREHLLLTPINDIHCGATTHITYKGEQIGYVELTLREDGLQIETFDQYDKRI